MGRELQSLAAAQVSLDHDFCVLNRFDATGAIAHFDGIQSTAHYLAWACAMNATVAREHVRVARALRELAGVVAEVELCELALELRA